jgi:hypothetical protein
VEVKITGENPFFDKGEHGFTDGPRYFLEAGRVRAGDYGEIRPTGDFLLESFAGYRMDGYKEHHAREMGRCGIYLYMGNPRLGYALFVARDEPLKKLQLALDLFE